MKLHFLQNVFVLQCAFNERNIPKQSGMLWHNEKKVWFTTELSVAASLQKYATPDAMDKIKKGIVVIEPWCLPLPPPPNGLTLMPHQKVSVFFSLERNRSYLGLDPGLGKTAVAATITRIYLIVLNHDVKVIYITPPFLVRNIINEFKMWAPEVRCSILTSKTANQNFSDSHVLILPDTFLASTWAYNFVADFTSGQSSILITDESHRFKNDTAKRTRALFGHGKTKGLVDLFEKQIFMSGTPMPNRPIELFPILSKAAPETIDFKNKFEYGMKYCNASENAYGWDFSGASNVKDLARRVIHPTGPFMLRMKKDLLDLPPKIEQVFLLADDMDNKLKNMDSQILKQFGIKGDQELINNLRTKAGLNGDDIHLTTYRRLLGEEKARAITPFIQSILEETDKSILIFAYHKEPIKILAEALKEYQPLVITGDTPMKDRQTFVDDFQTNPNKRVFIANYLAAGLGLTLTKANRCIFVEFSFVPAENDQAGDRAHRIGQKKTVLVQYIAYQDSIDEKVINSLIRKRRSTQHI